MTAYLQSTNNLYISSVYYSDKAFPLIYRGAICQGVESSLNDYKLIFFKARVY